MGSALRTALFDFKISARSFNRDAAFAAAEHTKVALFFIGAAGK